jgi:hypothetical protein
MQKMIAIMQGHQSHPSAAGPISDLRFLAACADRVERRRGTQKMRNDGRGKRAEKEGDWMPGEDGKGDSTSSLVIGIE